MIGEGVAVRGRVEREGVDGDERGGSNGGEFEGGVVRSSEDCGGRGIERVDRERGVGVGVGGWG